MKLYVGNLDEKIQSSHLKEAFSEFGKIVSAKVIFDKTSGKSRGFGFVEVQNETEGKDIIEKVNGATWEGKILHIRKAY